MHRWFGCCAKKIKGVIPENYEELTWKLLSSFPKGFQRVDIIATTYRNVSITTGERASFGHIDEVIIKSTKSKVPKDSQTLFCEMGNSS